MRPDLEVMAFIRSHSLKGAKCAECSTTFAASHGDGKVLACFPNGTGGLSFYVLCRCCGAAYKKGGRRAVPNVDRDCLITALMSPHVPKGEAPEWIH